MTDRAARVRALLISLLAAGTACLLLLLAPWSGAESLWPAEPSKNLKKNGKLQVDATHVNDGYFLAGLQKKSSKRIKLRVQKDGTTLTYDLNGDARFEVFPLQLGNGNYTITLYEQVSGKNYSASGKVTVTAKMRDTDSCFLYPNQYVNYTSASEAGIRADELCAGMNGREAFETVSAFMGSSFAYDYIKAMNIKSGTLPDIDGAYTKRMGICQDLAAIMCCMLRSRGLPARLMIGDADGNYHAWVQVRIDGTDYFFDPTVAVNGLRRVKSYTVERYY